MNSKSVIRLYFLLLLFNTLSTSFIWGINTLFLLDAGLSNTQAFLANAAFTLGHVIFEVPTGIVADSQGRQKSYLYGTLTLAFSTGLYWFLWQSQATFIWWVLSSVLLGLGYTFFSGATEAWLVDALHFTGYKKSLESVLARGQAVSGMAMLVGATLGGVIAQWTNLGVPYLLRSFFLLITFSLALIYMRDIGFSPTKSASIIKQGKNLFIDSYAFSFSSPRIRLLMLSAAFSSGVGFYTFYAMQPFLLQLYGNPESYFVAGLAASIVALAQIVGGLIVPWIRSIFSKRTDILIVTILSNIALLILVSQSNNFYVVLASISLWSLLYSLSMPVRQAYLNAQIPAQKRATLLSFDALFSSAGGSLIQPLLGRVADVHSYQSSFLVGSFFQLAALPFVIRLKKFPSPADEIQKNSS